MGTCSAEELAKGRDLSAEQHRTNFVRLFDEANLIGAGMAEALHAAEIDPAGWEPFADTIPTLRAIAAEGVAVRGGQ